MSEVVDSDSWELKWTFKQFWLSETRDSEVICAYENIEFGKKYKLKRFKICYKFSKEPKVTESLSLDVTLWSLTFVKK